MSYDEAIRGLLMSKILGKMTTEERDAFLAMQNNKSTAEILNLLSKQNQQITEIHDKVSKDNWVRDFGANIAGNAAYGGALWLLSRLIK